MEAVILDLDKLLGPREDSISGRHFGQGYAEREQVVKKLKSGVTFKIVISDKIAAINDSFWKGFLNEIFAQFKTKEKVKSMLTFEGEPYFIGIIEKNLDVLHAIYNS